MIYRIVLFPGSHRLVAVDRVLSRWRSDQNQAHPVEGIDYDPLPAVSSWLRGGTVKESSIEIINRKPERLEIGNSKTRASGSPPHRRYRVRTTVSPGSHFEGRGPAGKQSDAVLVRPISDRAGSSDPGGTYVPEKVYVPRLRLPGTLRDRRNQGNPQAARIWPRF
jgi:hypothetical protein